jgi:DNA-directed RNA polymerase subunit RPC12/RpoP
VHRCVACSQADALDDFPEDVRATLPPRTAAEKSTKRHLVVILEGAHLETGKTKKVRCPPCGSNASL